MAEPTIEEAKNIVNVDIGTASRNTQPTKGEFREMGSAQTDGESREFDEYGTGVINTVNNIGLKMSSRIEESLRTSLRKMSMPDGGGENTYANGYTPIQYSTKQLYKELGIETPFGETGTGDFEGLFVKASDKEYLKGIGLGHSVVINPPFQFNEHDDVRSDTYFKNIGRVYHEKTVDTYPIVVFEVGSVKYNTNLLTGSILDPASGVDTNLARSLRGDHGLWDSLVGGSVGLVKSVIKTGYNVVSYPFVKLLRLDKYYHFENQTNIFRNYFNDMASLVAAMLGLLEPIEEGKGEDVDYSAAPPQSVVPAEGTTAPQPTTPADGTTGESDYYGGYPKATNISGSSGITPADAQALRYHGANPDTPSGIYAGGIIGDNERMPSLDLVHILPGMNAAERDYLPFLIDKEISITESISNSTQENPLMAEANAKAAEAEAAKNNGGASAGSITEVASNLSASIKKQAQRALDSLAGGETGTIISGEGRLNLPEMWSDSQFERNVSFSFKFNSPYGHDLSIFENVYIPFLILFCMASPRQIGKKSYTNPFFIKAHSRGLFSIPLGIVQSLSVTRGEDKNNWSLGGHPRSIKCDMTIKDLSPNMMMSMMRGKLFPLFQGNESFKSYITTMGGLSLAEQKKWADIGGRFWNRMKNRLKIGDGKLVDWEGVGMSLRNTPIVKTMFKGVSVGVIKNPDSRGLSNRF